MICWHRSRTLKRHRRNFSLLHGTNNTHNMNWPENTPTYSPFSKLKTQAFNVFVAANSLIIHICPRARLAFLGHVAETRQTQSVINELNLFGNWKMSTCPRGTSCQVSSFIYSHKMQRKTDDCYPKKEGKKVETRKWTALQSTKTLDVFAVFLRRVLLCFFLFSG